MEQNNADIDKILFIFQQSQHGDIKTSLSISLQFISFLQNNKQFWENW